MFHLPKQNLDISTAPIAARQAPEFSLITHVPAEPVPMPHWQDPRYLYRYTQSGSAASRNGRERLAHEGRGARI